MRLHLIAAVMLVSLQANASIEQQVIQCSAITKEPQRLACYDTLAANIHSINAVTPTQPITPVAPIAPIAPAAPVSSVAPATLPVAGTPVPAPSTAQAEASFGMEAKQVREELTDKIFLDVQSVKADAYGALKITFTNGQIWKQTESRKYSLKAGEKVYIERGVLGSFYLGTESRNAKIRVTRLK
ncbi:hypothetical protein [Shewanella acanthi]|uniref:hypothetical protein n=1 Tax=Shewanella acanthi TaxID=2864212 RepID=UPI001C654EB1|nr:hypothetical protein [Shewanella acanthi]QYJ78523.1 hypothetical protein K0H61_15725 [Shewanella acanthi]